MSRPARCNARTNYEMWQARKRGESTTLRLPHLFTSWTSYTGDCCSWCGRPRSEPPTHLNAPRIVTEARRVGLDDDALDHAVDDGTAPSDAVALPLDAQ